MPFGMSNQGPRNKPSSGGSGGSSGGSGGSWGSGFLSDLMSFLGSGVGLGTIGGILTSIFGGATAAQASPYDEATKYALETLMAKLPGLESTPYSKGEVEGKVSGMKSTLRGAADVSAGRVGASLAEGLGAAGVPKGHPSASIFTSEMAPVIARGEEGAVQAEQYGMDFFANMDNAAKQRLLQGLNLMMGGAGMQPTMTPGQEGFAGFMQTLNLLATGAGNIGSAYKDLTHKTIEG